MAVLYERDDVCQSQASEVARIVARLESASPARADLEPHTGARRTTKRRRLIGRLAWPASGPAWRFAAAVALLAVVAVIAWPRPPALPDAHETTLRGTTVRTITPHDDVAVSPTSFAWQAHPNATTYRVRLLGVDDAVLWNGQTAADRIDLPADATEGLQPMVRYSWTVEALNEAGALVAASEPRVFRIVPTDTPPVTRDR